MKILVGFNNKSLCQILAKALEGEAEVVCAKNYDEFLTNLPDFDVGLVESNFDGHNLVAVQSMFKDKKVIFIVPEDMVGLIVPYVTVSSVSGLDVDDILKKINEVVGGEVAVSEQAVEVSVPEPVLAVQEVSKESVQEPAPFEAEFTISTEEEKPVEEEKTETTQPVLAGTTVSVEPAQVNELIRKEVRYAVREAVWDLLPEILREVVEKEVQKIIRERLAQ